MTVLAFADPGCDDVARSGGKGASLARMAALGLPVPPGFVVAADALAAALPDGGAALRALVAGAGAGTGDAARAELARRAQEIVGAAPISSALRDDLARAYAALDGDEPAVAVRSSACAEDGDAASFAGQQETYLHVRGIDAVVERVRDCWASFFSERALFYRGERGSLDDLDMAVVVQRMVDADVAGVLFTVDPVRGRKDSMVVEAVFGLGEGVVSGEITPDHYVLKRDGSVRRRQLAVQPFAIVSDPAGGTREQALEEARGGEPTLDDEQLRALAELGAGLQERAGQPQDVEWAMQGGELFVLQARPVTT
jgi:pyruvate, water dikinase